MRKHWSRAIIASLIITLSSLWLSGCSLPGQKQFSGVQVEMMDSSVSQVYLDGLHYGQTPFEKRDIRPGTYTLRIEPAEADKKPYETQIHLYPDTLTSVLWSFEGSEPTGTGEILELEPLASQERSELSVITVPEGAKVSLDSKSYGLSPTVVESVSAGQYNLAIEAVAHVKKAISINLQPGYRLHVFSRLAKESDALAVTPDSSASGETTPPAENTLAPSPSASPLAMAPSPSPNEPAKPYVTIRETGTGWLRVRDEAANTGAEVARLDVGNKYPYRSTLNGWYEIEYETGKTGWISGQYADIIR